MDMSDTIVAKSDQQNADDYAAGPKTVTIEKAVVSKGDQPVNIHLEEFPGKPYRPSKSMRRVLVQVWGKHSEEYAGRKLTLYRDPEVKYAGEPVGGLKISHMSHLDKARTIPLTETRGKKAPHRVQPLQETTQPDPIEQTLAAAWDNTERLQKAVQWTSDNNHPLHQKAVDRLAELEGEVQP